MKLLFDENLSPKLVGRLVDIFMGSAHVRDLGLNRAADPLVWQYARDHGFLIVSKDDDFRHLSFLRGAPPKVIGILTGNCSTATIAELLRSRRGQIEQFHSDTTSSFLPLT